MNIMGQSAYLVIIPMECSGSVRVLDCGLKGCWFKTHLSAESLCCVREQDTLSAA